MMTEYPGVDAGFDSWLAVNMSPLQYSGKGATAGKTTSMPLGVENRWPCYGDVPSAMVHDCRRER